MHSRALGLRFMSHACRTCAAQVRPQRGALCLHSVRPTCAHSPRVVLSWGRRPSSHACCPGENGQQGNILSLNELFLQRGVGIGYMTFALVLAYPRPCCISRESTSVHVDGNDVLCNSPTEVVIDKHSICACRLGRHKKCLTRESIFEYRFVL